MNIISRWLRKRKEASNEERFLRGYDYAAGRLLREGDCAIGNLEMEADNPFDRDSFDEGIESAVRDYSQLGKALI